MGMVSFFRCGILGSIIKNKNGGGRKLDVFCPRRLYVKIFYSVINPACSASLTIGRVLSIISKSWSTGFGSINTQSLQKSVHFAI